MTSNITNQRLYDSISLVPRVGDRAENELCVMSLVALLAGEQHTDRPNVACPVIATFAIKVNDGIDCDARQTLKPFAPRIIGTRDNLARARARLLANSILSEVLPRQAADAGHRVPESLVAQLRIRSTGLETEELQDLYELLKCNADTLGLNRTRLGDVRYLLRAYARGSDELVGNTCAAILSDFARHPVTLEGSGWYWNKAVELIDRICDIGDGIASAGAQVEHHANTEAQRIRAQEAYGPIIKRLFKSRRPRTPTAA